MSGLEKGTGTLNAKVPVPLSRPDAARNAGQGRTIKLHPVSPLTPYRGVRQSCRRRHAWGQFANGLRKLSPGVATTPRPPLGSRTMRRVVITGLGVVAPNGIGKEAFWSACVNGKTGVG